MKHRRLLLCLVFSLFSTTVFATTERAIFAGGCFWCMQPPFDKTPGVTETVVGYDGGHQPFPTYERVSANKTNYVESIEVTYDPAKVTYQKLLHVFWHNVDPTRDDGQFCDRGDQYRPVIFYLNQQQKQQAEASKTALEKSGKIKQPIKVAIIHSTRFWPAELYHQNYYKKNPIRYKFYRSRCGRDRRLRELWGN